MLIICNLYRVILIYIVDLNIVIIANFSIYKLYHNMKINQTPTNSFFSNLKINILVNYLNIFIHYSFNNG